MGSPISAAGPAGDPLAALSKVIQVNDFNNKHVYEYRLSEC